MKDYYQFEIDLDNSKPEELAVRIGQIVEAAESGSKILAAFGFNITDSLGNLLPWMYIPPDSDNAAAPQ